MGLFTHHGPVLIRPVNRMDGLARPSLEPIRSTERETASPSSVVSMYVREYRAALYWMYARCFSLPPLCTLSLHHVHFCPLFLRTPPSFSVLCLHSIRSHVVLSCCPGAACCWVTFCVTANKRQNSPQESLSAATAMNFNCFFITQNSLVFHH